MSNPVSVAPQPVIADGSARGPMTLNATASGDTTVLANANASLSIIITNVWVSNRGSSNITVSLREGTAGTERWKGMLAADGGGYTTSFHPQWKLAAGTALVVNLSAGGNVDVNVQFYLG